ncbi:MAG: glucokinase [Deltaproteobacteria bacterium]|nr:glucokinase [Deltaproteobacteria bacterium]
MSLILAGDIGGTHTRLALFEPGHVREPRLLRVYASSAHAGLAALVETYLRECGSEAQRVTRAVFGAAGPVEKNVARVTNLPWVVDAEALRVRLKLERVRVINDFEAVCRAVPGLDAGDLHSLGGEAPSPDAPIVVLGAGTGLGQGVLLPDSGGWRVVPSEGGHVEFAPHDALGRRLLHYLAQRFPRVTWERVLGGAALSHLYAFLRDREGVGENPALVPRMRTEDPAAVITQQGGTGQDLLCARTLELYATLYGSLAGNLVLTSLARGGVYLAGGIAPRILPVLAGGAFRAGFNAKEQFSEFMARVPAWVIIHPQPGLMGAALAAEEA